MNKFIKTAETLKPELYNINHEPVCGAKAVKDENHLHGWKMVSDDTVGELIHRNGSDIYDFGKHLVGYLSFDIEYTGMFDCPLRLKIIFGEIPAEVAEGFDGDSGALGRGWLQDEVIVIDDLTQRIELPRRYAFRYVRIISEWNTGAIKFRICNIRCNSVSSADSSCVTPLLESVPEIYHQIDHASLNTLKNCMQTVFEDGPKRDRRLWLGDFRLQAKLNYLTFRNFDLCKRCLYLFAGTVDANGRLPACLYEKPEVHSGELFIYDYTALFVPTLLEYAEASGDWKTAEQLWPTALRQLEIVMDDIDANGLFRDNGKWWLFIDWSESLDKQTALQGVVIFALKQGRILAEKLNITNKMNWMDKEIERLSHAAMKYMYDESEGYFVSGKDRQLSIASQVWMIIAGVIEADQASELLRRCFASQETVMPAGPYLYHYVLEAMLIAGMEDQALELINDYWGGMLAYGTDTFWEVYDPNDLYLSPYGNHLMNSYCHAWSCTPAYFLRIQKA